MEEYRKPFGGTSLEEQYHSQVEGMARMKQDVENKRRLEEAKEFERDVRLLRSQEKELAKSKSIISKIKRFMGFK